MDWIQAAIETYLILLMVLVPAFAVAAGIGAHRLTYWWAERNPIVIDYTPGQRLLSRQKQPRNPNGPTIAKCVGKPIGGAEHCW